VKIEVTVACLLLLTNQGASQELHPKIASNEKVIRTVLILPPKVQIVRRGVKGTESMIKESEDLEGAVLTTISRVLGEKKISVAANPFTAQALDAGTDLKYTVADIQTRYDELLPKIRKKSKDVAKGRFTLGDEVLKVNPDGAADALVFIRGHGVMPTKGKQIFGALTLSPAFPVVGLSISLIDAHTGEVLVFAKPTACGDAVRNGESIFYKPIVKSLKKMPSAP